MKLGTRQLGLRQVATAIRPLVPPAVLQTAAAREAIADVREALAVRTIMASGAFDQPWYELQRRRSFSSQLAAVVDYVHHGRRRGLSPTPLFEPEWFDPKRWNGAPSTRSRCTCAGRPGRGRPHPLFDATRHQRTYYEARKHPGGPLAHFLSIATDDTPLPLPPGAAYQQVTYGQLRARAIAAVQTWHEQEACAGRRAGSTPCHRSSSRPCSTRWPGCGCPRRTSTAHW
jgi:hypothetical protein